MSELFNRLLNLNNIIKAIQQTYKKSYFKESSQRIEHNLILIALKIQQDLLNGTYQQSPTKPFIYNERGHVRVIQALTPYDLTVQHLLCNEILIPELQKYLIHDNGASIKGKGISFTRRRFEEHLRSYIGEHGTTGYILLIDFKKFFDNIDHYLLYQALKDKLKDDRVLNLVKSILKANEIDISFNHDLEQKIFNSLEYSKIPNHLKTKQYFMRKSLGIGSPISQIAGVFYPTPIDTYCKYVRRCKHYARYMDDIYIIHHDKQELQGILQGVIEQANKLKITVNPAKTHIQPITKEFVYLKTKYLIQPNGKILKRIHPTTLNRERRKLRLLAHKQIPKQYLINQFKSWIGDKDFYKCNKSIKRISTYFNLLLSTYYQED